MKNNEKVYTIGEIYRLGLLKNNKGEAYKHKATISRIVSKLNFKLKKTPFGPAKVLTIGEIESFNSSWN